MPEALSIPSAGVGGVGATQLIIIELLSVEDEFDIAVATVRASEFAISGAMRARSAPATVSGSGVDSARRAEFMSERWLPVW